MDRSSTRDLLAGFASAAALLLLVPAAPARAAGPVSRPLVSRSTRNRKSAPLREYRLAGPTAPATEHEIENGEIPGKRGLSAGGDRVVQRRVGPRSLQALAQFEGGSDADNDQFSGRTVPPDTNGDVGPNHYVQYINLFFTIYDKTGAAVLGPLPGNAFWAGLGTACETQNDGDPIVQYDQLADRWLVSQFALPNFPDGPFHQCVAVSTTPDPTEEYYQYDFVFDDTIINDYPKFAVWPDAYYMTANEFQSPDFDAVGAAAVAFDRAAMLAGEPATMVRFDIAQEGGVLPSDLEGATPPPAGSPNFLLTFDTNPARLSEWRFHPDFAQPEASSLDGPFDIPISAFDVPVCGNPREACVAQLGSSELLEVLGGRVMYRLGYRRFADHESLVTNFTVNAADPGSQAAIRWCEVRDPNGSPFVQQEGTYAPDAEHRFMGSIAMDAIGNVALGYSESGSDMHPSLAVAGRLVGDPAGTLGAEEVFLAGTGSQTDSNGRWGDYSSMSVDPSDDCTFWFTGEYYAATGAFDWHTRVATFRFPSCTTGATGTIEGTVTDGSSPIAGAAVAAGDSATTTDASGHYVLRLPVGVYDMTASKFGYIGASAPGVAVTDGGDAVQDFTLPPAPTHLVNGVVRDASGGGWPLYARIDVAAEDGYPGATLFTDPVTGYYSITLVGGGTYHFTINGVSSGYLPLAQAVPVPVSGGDIVQNLGLSADLQACSAPGYTGALSQDFSAGLMPPGWTTRSTEGADWTVSSGTDPCGEWDGNLTGGAGAFGLIQTSCEHVLADSQLRTPVVNLLGSTSPVIAWHSDYRDLGSIADVDVSNDAGATWTNVWRRAGVDERGPGLQSVDISDLAAGQPAVEARFHYTAFFGWWWQIDDVFLGDSGATCHALQGGLVVGEVRDANTGAGIVGATVSVLPHEALARTIATPDDPNVGDGFYAIYGGSGSRTLEGSMQHYGAQDLGVTVVPGAAVRLDFALAAGRLSASPTPFSAKVLPGQSLQQTLTLSNAGSREAGFEIAEIDVPLADASSHPVGFASEASRVRALSRLVPPGHGSGLRRFGERSAKDLPALPDGPPAMPTLPAGRVLATYPSDVNYAWGIAYDTEADDYWLTNMLQSGGDDRIYRFLPDGTKTGDTIDEHPAITGVFAADGTYNPRTHTIWQVDAVPMGSSCIFEADPATKTLTGRTICPVTGTSERGLAYDPATDTYYIGSWNDGVLKHFDSNGTVLDSKSVGLNIAGLAYNATTSHLFVLTDLPDLGHDVFVFDTAHDYAPVGAFPVTDDSGAHVLVNGAGLEADCSGNLWVVDQSPQLVYKVVSGEQGFCPVDIPWLTLDPSSGTVPGAAGARAGGSSTLPVSVGLDASGLFAGLHRAQLRIGTDTPYPVPPIAVGLTVRFLDVPEDDPPGAYPFESYVYGAAGAGVMPGCDQNGFRFCPNEGVSGAAGLVTRADMAAYVWRAVHGPFAPPPVYTGIFTDVNPFDRNADYIQGVYDDGITAGCQGPGEPKRFCPGQTITRGQMAVFVEKAVRGAEFTPPACQGIFTDVPCPPDAGAPFGDWIELLFHDGITAGCNAAGEPAAFCPARAIPNDQMAVFLVKAFGLAR